MTEESVEKIISDGGLDAATALEYAENMPLDELLEAAQAVCSGAARRLLTPVP